MGTSQDSRDLAPDPWDLDRGLWGEAEDLARLGAWEWNLETGRVSMSPGWLRIHGALTSPTSIEELEPFAYFEDRAAVMSALERTRTAGEIYAMVHRIVRADDGAVRWVQARGRRAMGPTGERVVRGIAIDVTESHEAQLRLREREETFRRHYQENPLPTYTVERRDGELSLVDANRAALTQLGGGRAPRALGKPLSLIWADRPDLLAEANRCLAEQTVLRRETEYVSYSTRARGLFGFVFVPLTSSSLMLHCEELTGRRAMEHRVMRRIRALTAPRSQHEAPRLEELIDADELRELQENLRSAVGLETLVVDVEGRIVSAAMDDLVSSLLRVWPPDDGFEGPSVVRDGLWRLSSPLEVEGRRLGHLVGLARIRGAPVDLQAWSRRTSVELSDVRSAIAQLPEASESVLAWAGRLFARMATMVVEAGHRNLEQARVIVQKDRAEQVSSETEARYQRLFREAPDGIVLADAVSGEILDCNEAFLELGGWRREEVVGFAEAELHDESFPGHRSLVPLPASDTSFASRLESTRGEPVDVLIRAHRARHDEMDVVLASYRDVTLERRLEDRLLQTQKLESLGLMAGGIAHHFNNLLAAIVGNAELAQFDVVEGTDAAVSLQEIRAAAERARGLTAKMLAYSGHHPLSTRAVDLTGLIRGLDGPLRLRVASDTTVTFDLENDLPEVSVDAGQIRQVVLNLVANASEARRREPLEITIRTYSRDLGPRDLSPEEQAQGAQPGLHAVIEIADTGAGMDEATRRRAFEPFFTTRGFGRGLGLSAVLGIVRAHRGAVRLDSAPGAGTTVRLAFPRATKTHRSVTPVHRLRGRAVVIEDERELRSVLSRLLRRLGYRVEEYDSGEVAVDRLERPEEIELALVDFTMPGSSGLDIVDHLRRLGVRGCLLLMSGHSDPGARAAGADGFLQKPFTMQELEAILQPTARSVPPSEAG